MRTSINFNTDSVYDLFLDFLQGDPEVQSLFYYIGEGSSKACYSFMEESTNEKYVVKIEKDFYSCYIESNYELDLTCEDIEEDNECFQQTSKEIGTYKWAKENGLDLFLAPIVLEHSNAYREFEVMPYVENINVYRNNDIIDRVEAATNSRCYSDTLEGFIADYLSVAGEFSLEMVEKLKSIGEKLMNVNAQFFEDASRSSNLGLYKGRLVLRDYGYGFPNF